MCDKIFKTIKKITVSITDFRRNIRIRSKGEEDFFLIILIDNLEEMRTDK